MMMSVSVSAHLKSLVRGAARLLPLLLLSVSFSSVSAQRAGRDVKFKKFHLWDEFYTEAITYADVNKDGKLDIIAGARWFEAPDWTAHDIWKHKKFFYTKGYSDSFLNFAEDLNGDGWVDLICFDFPGREVYWYENPKGKDQLWKRTMIDSIAANESPVLVDVDGDGQKDLIYSNHKTKQMFWHSYSVKKGQVVWEHHPVSSPGFESKGAFAHGLGWGDINGDGINDIITIDGWWEAPKGNIRKAKEWTFHRANLGKPCAQMIVYDYNGDGLNDVLSSSAHDYGVWWHEQVRDASGKIDFITHNIDTTFSEPHAVVQVDVNGDGLPDFVTGKRFFSHQGHGPGGLEPPVLYWFELLKDGRNRPVWVRHEIDNMSGVGIQFEMPDMNGDGKPDIIIGNKNGVFYFEQQ